jgi:hypothetical protein
VNRGAPHDTRVGFQSGADRSEGPGVVPDECDVCGSGDLVERRCKVICRNCHSIVKSCADL